MALSHTVSGFCSSAQLLRKFDSPPCHLPLPVVDVAVRDGACDCRGGKKGVSLNDGYSGEKVNAQPGHLLTDACHEQDVWR